MSEIDFVLSGASGENFAEWDYDRQCEDEITFAPGQPSFIEQKNLVQRPLSQRISYNADQKFTYSLIDNMIQVKSFSKSFREDKSEFWSSKRLKTGIGSLGFLVGGVASFPMSLPWLGAGLIAASFFGFYRTYQAHNQVGNWRKDIPQMVANQRKEAFDSGLLSAYKRDEMGARNQPSLFSKVLSGTELCGLYIEYLDQYQKDLAQGKDSGEKIKLLEKAAKEGPLTEKLMSYARLHPNFSALLTLYAQEHAQFAKVFGEVEQLREDKIKQIQKDAYHNISSVESSKAAALAVAYTTYNLYQRNAEAKLKDKLDSFPSSPNYDSYRQDAIKEFHDGMSQAKSIRDTSIQLISLPFDSRIESIRQERNNCIKEIRMNFNAHLLPLFSHLAALHKEAYQVAIGAQAPRQVYNTAAYYPQFPSFPQMQPVPSAPSMDEILRERQQNYNPQIFREMLEIYHSEAAKA